MRARRLPLCILALLVFLFPVRGSAQSKPAHLPTAGQLTAAKDTDTIHRPRPDTGLLARRAVAPRPAAPRPVRAARPTLRVTSKRLSGIRSGTGLQATTQCVGDACGGGGGGGGGGSAPAVSVTPDGSPWTVSANSSGNTRVFTITNTGTAAGDFFAACQVVGAITCQSVVMAGGADPNDFVLNPGDVTTATVTFSAGAPGSGTLKLFVEVEPGPISDYGSYAITISGSQLPPTVALERFNRDGIDRGQCFTTGAGPAAASSCGDLIVTHGLPGFRTMGKDRSLNMIYNSAASGGLTLVAAKVTQGANTATPTRIVAILNINGATDSVDFNPSGAGDVRQIVLGRNLAAPSTGIYPFSLKVRNVYGTAIQETVVNDTVVVVNNSGSEFGRGWLVGGVERLYLAQPGGSILWMAGDGSALRYTQVNSTTWIAPKMDFRDTIIKNPDTTYTRLLRHGAQVIFDATGRHIKTINRQGWTTTFAYGTVSGLTRLTSIKVPAIDTITRSYKFFYSGASVMLDSIRDPVNRAMKILRTGTQDTVFTDPDGQSTMYSYFAGHSRLKGIGVPNPAHYGLRSWYWYDYSYGTKLTSVSVPADSAAGAFYQTLFTPWDQNGIGIAGIQNADPTYPAGGFVSLVDGPLTGTGDQLQVWVDRFGGPVKLIQTFTGATTLIAKSDSAHPDLVTRVQYPLGRVVNMLYNARGNLVRQIDSTSGLPVAIDSTVYGDPSTPDGPTGVRDPMGRWNSYTYNTMGLTDVATAPNGHQTQFSYTSQYQLSGVTEVGVPVWIDSISDTLSRDLTTMFKYDSLGNTRWVTNPVNATTTTYADSIGRVIMAWNQFGTMSRTTYDAMNRVVTQLTYKEAQTNPYPVPGAGRFHLAPACLADEVICVDSTVAWRGTIPDTFVTKTFNGLAGVDSVLDPRGVHHGYRYNASGVVVRDLDEARVPSISFFGATGLLDSIKTRDSMVVRYGYDGMGRKIWQAWRSRFWGKRGLSNQVDSVTIKGDSVLYSYDIEGHLLRSWSKKVGLDSLSRTYYANGAVKTRVSNMMLLDSLTYGYDAGGARTSMVHTTIAGGQTARDTTYYRYSPVTGTLDTMIVKVALPASVGTRTVTFEWDPLGRRTAVNYPNGFRIVLAYDAVGAMRRLSGNSLEGGCTSTDNRCVTVTHVDDAIGRTLRSDFICGGQAHEGWSCGSSPSQTLTTANQYYRTGWLATQRNSYRTDSLEYDASGNISRRRNYDDYWHALVMQGLHSNRLAMDSVNLGAAGVSHKYYKYDGAGSRVSDSVPGLNWSIVADRFWFYDGLGRISGIANWRHITPTSWGLFQDPTGCRHDAEGKLIQSCTASSDNVAFDGDNVVATDGGIWHFYHGPGVDDPIFGIGQASNGVLKELYWVTDGAGRQYAVSQADGTWDSQLEEVSGWFGWRQAGGVKNSEGYDAGRQESSDVPAVSFFRNRVYDQQAGRWTQEDPTGVAGGVNLYQYSGNNPVSYSDPFGLWPFGTHNQAVNNALPNAGFIDRTMIKLGSLFVDLTTQSTKDSYIHSMAEAGQNPLAQQAGTREYIQGHEAAAGASEANGHHLTAMFELGMAMHPVMDHASPAHTDEHGQPRVWNPADLKAHRAAESGPPTAAQTEQMNSAMRAMYTQVTGNAP